MQANANGVSVEDGIGDGVTEGLGEGEGDGLGEADGDALGEGEGVADGDADGDADGLAEVVGDADGEAEGPVWIDFDVAVIVKSGLKQPARENTAQADPKITLNFESITPIPRTY